MINTNSHKSINELRQKPRVLVFSVNVLLAWIVFYFSTGNISPFSTDPGIWLLAVIAYWFWVLITTPFFRPPKDSLAIAISVILLLVPIDFSVVQFFLPLLQITYIIAIIISLFVATLALIAIFKQSDDKDNLLSKVSYQLSEKLGRGEILFTPVILISALGFYQNNIQWALLIFGFWVLMVVVKPVELIAKVIVYFKDLKGDEAQISESIGSIMRIDNPDIVRVSLVNSVDTWNNQEVYLMHLPNNKNAYVLPLFVQIQNEEIIGTGLFCVTSEKPSFKTVAGNIYRYKKDGLVAELIEKLSGVGGNSNIVGIIIERSTIGNIKFQVVSGTELEEGMVVFTNIKGKKVYYQILDAVTGEESFKENPFGMHVVSAPQLGFYDSKDGFKKFPWLPEMNQPVFLVPSDEIPKQILEENEFMT